METFNTYEIYICDHKTGRAGWDIKYVSAPSAKALETMPLFDCVILKQWTNQTLGQAKTPGPYCDGIVWDGKQFL